MRGGLAALLLLSGCIDGLEPGEFGTLRYFGEVRGERPLRMVPPIGDRDGNAYVLYGARDVAMVEGFVGLAAGGWAGGCTIHEGDDRGLHGWVGSAQDRAWYWSGDALVEVSGHSGGCQSIADRDAGSNADVAFLGVAPWVREAPSRTTLLALVKSPSDAVPFEGVVDLDARRTDGLRRFEPSDASSVEVLGTGGDASRELGVFLVRYHQGTAIWVDAVFLGAGGQRESVATIDGAWDFGEDAVVGSLQFAHNGLVGGLLVSGDLVLFGRQGGFVRPVDNGMSPVGLHAWNGDLWLVGTQGATPVVARLDDDGNPGSPTPWRASERAAEALAGRIAVLDDRSEPRRWIGWDFPGSAMGEHPLVAPEPPSRFGDDTTGWLVAGPSFDAGGEPRTSVAFGPLGISYP
jgi:hypothetical protein